MTSERMNTRGSSWNQFLRDAIQTRRLAKVTRDCRSSKEMKTVKDAIDIHSRRTRSKAVNEVQEVKAKPAKGKKGKKGMKVDASGDVTKKVSLKVAPVIVSSTSRSGGRKIGDDHKRKRERNDSDALDNNEASMSPSSSSISIFDMPVYPSPSDVTSFDPNIFCVDEGQEIEGNMTAHSTTLSLMGMGYLDNEEDGNGMIVNKQQDDPYDATYFGSNDSIADELGSVVMVDEDTMYNNILAAYVDSEGCTSTEISGRDDEVDPLYDSSSTSCDLANPILSTEEDEDAFKLDLPAFSFPSSTDDDPFESMIDELNRMDGLNSSAEER